jgi:hypothetical protein
MTNAGEYEKRANWSQMESSPSTCNAFRVTYAFLRIVLSGVLG